VTNTAQQSTTTTTNPTADLSPTGPVVTGALERYGQIDAAFDAFLRGDVQPDGATSDVNPLDPRLNDWFVGQARGVVSDQINQLLPPPYTTVEGPYATAGTRNAKATNAVTVTLEDCALEGRSGVNRFTGDAAQLGIIVEYKNVTLIRSDEKWQISAIEVLSNATQCVRTDDPNGGPGVGFA
jgi:hypothetical protein